MEVTHNLSFVQQDGLATCVVLLYVLTLISVCEKLVSKQLLSSALSRKIVHCGAASWLIFWPLYSHSSSDNWSWRLNVFVPVVKGLQLFWKGAIVRNPNDKDVVSMSRTGDPRELLLGPLQFTLVMTVVGLLLFRSPSSCLIMGAVGIGDGIAPLVGSRYGTHKYRSPYVNEAGTCKSVEGSVAVFAGTVFGYYVYSFVISAPITLSAYAVCVCAIVAALVEGLSPSNIDNLAIPVAVYFVYNLFG